MRQSVIMLTRLGALPPEHSADPGRVAEVEQLVNALLPPASLAEAEALCPLLGDDACFGLAWSLVHFIESAPGISECKLPLSQTHMAEILRARLSASGRAPE